MNFDNGEEAFNKAFVFPIDMTTDEINVEIKSICRQGSTMPLSKLLSNKILKLYEPILHEYICENFADREL